MLHIPAHKNVTNPPGQWINTETVQDTVQAAVQDKPVHEVREPAPKPYIPPKQSNK